MVALAAGQITGPGTAQHEPAGVPATVDVTVSAMGVATVGAPGQPEPAQRALPKRPAHYLWAVLIACICEVLPLVCPICGGPMRLIAFITHSTDIRQILNHIGVDAEPPRITPARGGPLRGRAAPGAVQKCANRKISGDWPALSIQAEPVCTLGMPKP